MCLLLILMSLVFSIPDASFYHTPVGEISEFEEIRFWPYTVNQKSYYWVVKTTVDLFSTSSESMHYTFKSTETYTVQLLVTDNSSNMDLQEQTYVIQDKLSIPVLKMNSDHIMEGDTVQFDVETIEPVVNCSIFIAPISSPDEGVFLECTGNLTFLYAGEYRAVVKIVDDDLTKNEKSYDVLVYDSFSFNILDVIYDRPVIRELEYTTFTLDVVELIDPKYTVLWDFGVDQIIVQNNKSVIYQFDHDGTYSVEVTLTDDDFQSTSINIPLTVEKILPVAEMNLHPFPNGMKEGDMVNLTYTGGEHPHEEKLITECKWVISYNSQRKDVFSEYCHDLFYRFEFAGNYSISLTVYDNDGGVSETEKTVFDIGDSPPNIKIILKQTDVFEEQSVGIYLDLELFDGSYEIRWDFGIEEEYNLNTTLYEPISSPVYHYVGNYVIKCQLLDDDNNFVEDSISFDVEPLLPVAKMEISPNPLELDVFEGSLITFISKSFQSHPEKIIILITWHIINPFNEIEESTEETVFYFARHTGPYSVQLTVVDNVGASDVQTLNFFIKNVFPEAMFIEQFSGELEIGVIGSFFDTSQIHPGGNIESSKWRLTMPNGQRSVQFENEDFIYYKFCKTGKYQLTLEVVDDDGDVSSFFQEYEIENSQRQVDFKWRVQKYRDDNGMGVYFDIPEDYLIPECGEPVRFIEWDFGRYGKSNEQSVYIEYDKMDKYIVSLVLTDQLGGSNYKVKYVGCKECSRGTCQYPGTCVCFFGWSGKNCDVNLLHEVKVREHRVPVHIDQTSLHSYTHDKFVIYSHCETDYHGIFVTSKFELYTYGENEMNDYIFQRKKIYEVDISDWNSIPIKVSCTRSSMFVLTISSSNETKMYSMGYGIDHEITQSSSKFVIDQRIKNVIDIQSSWHTVYVLCSETTRRGVLDVYSVGSNLYSSLGTKAKKRNTYFNFSSEYSLLDMSNIPRFNYNGGIGYHNYYSQYLKSDDIILPIITPIEHGVILRYSKKHYYYCGENHPSTGENVDKLTLIDFNFNNDVDTNLESIFIRFMDRMNDGYLFIISEDNKIYQYISEEENEGVGLGLKEIDQLTYGDYVIDETEEIWNFVCGSACFLVTSQMVYVIGKNDLCNNGICTNFKEYGSFSYVQQFGGRIYSDSNNEQITTRVYSESEPITFSSTPKLLINHSFIDENGVLCITIEQLFGVTQYDSTIDFFDTRTDSFASSKFCSYPDATSSLWNFDMFGFIGEKKVNYRLKTDVDTLIRSGYSQLGGCHWWLSSEGYGYEIYSNVIRIGSYFTTRQRIVTDINVRMIFKKYVLKVEIVSGSENDDFGVVIKGNVYNRISRSGEIVLRIKSEEGKYDLDSFYTILNSKEVFEKVVVEIKNTVCNMECYQTISILYWLRNDERICSFNSSDILISFENSKSQDSVEIGVNIIASNLCGGVFYEHIDFPIQIGSSLFEQEGEKLNNGTYMLDDIVFLYIKNGMIDVKSRDIVVTDIFVKAVEVNKHIVYLAESEGKSLKEDDFKFKMDNSFLMLRRNESRKFSFNILLEIFITSEESDIDETGRTFFETDIELVVLGNKREVEESILAYILVTVWFVVMIIMTALFVAIGGFLLFFYVFKQNLNKIIQLRDESEYYE